MRPEVGMSTAGVLALDAAERDGAGRDGVGTGVGGAEVVVVVVVWMPAGLRVLAVVVVVVVVEPAFTSGASATAPEKEPAQVSSQTPDFRKMAMAPAMKSQQSNKNDSKLEDSPLSHRVVPISLSLSSVGASRPARKPSEVCGFMRR